MCSSDLSTGSIEGGIVAVHVTGPTAPAHEYLVETVADVAQLQVKSHSEFLLVCASSASRMRPRGARATSGMGAS